MDYDTKKLLVFILNNTNYTKANPTGFLLSVCAGVEDGLCKLFSSEFMLNIQRSGLFNMFQLTMLTFTNNSLVLYNSVYLKKLDQF